jgi:hypothetical protein
MNVTGRMLMQILLSCTYTKCEKINLLFSSHTYKKFCQVHMQHYAAFATLQNAILFTQKNENRKQLQHTTPSPTCLINAREGIHPPNVQQIPDT